MSSHPFLPSNPFEDIDLKLEFPPPPPHPCPPTCQSSTHGLHRVRITSSSSPPSSPPPQPRSPTPRAPRSPHRPTYDIALYSPPRGDDTNFPKLPLVVPGYYLSEGVIAPHIPPSEPSTSSARNGPRSFTVVMAKEERHQEKMKQKHQSLGVPPLPVSPQTVLPILKSIDASDTVTVLVSPMPEATGRTPIPEFVTRMASYHINYEELMKETYVHTHALYPLASDADRPDFFPAADGRGGRPRPSVLQSLFTRRAEAEAHEEEISGQRMAVIGLKKTLDEAEEMRMSTSKVLVAVLQAMGRPERVEFEKDTGDMEFGMMSFMRRYRRLSRSTKKAEDTLRENGGSPMFL